MLVKNLWLRLLALLFCAATTEPKGQERAFGKKLWWLAVLAIGLAKLWAVAGDEILVQENDATSYAWSTTGMIWGRAGDALPSHPPGMALVAGTIAQFGIPWRVALEVLYLGACSALAAALAGLLCSRFVALLLFTMMAWHPWTFAGFHDFMADPFLLLVSVALLACLLKLLSQSSSHWRWPLFLASGGLLFLWAWSRYEEPLLYGTYGLFALLAWALTQKEVHPAALSRRLALLVSPVLIAVLLGALAQKANYSHFGLRAKAQIGAPGLMALLKALYRIKPERDLLYAPVTHQSLQAACQVSPALKIYEKSLLDTNASAVKFGEQVNNTPGEFGSWLNWLLTQSFPSDPRLANEQMLKASAEINASLRKGLLPARSAHFPIDPNWRLWGPQLLPSMKESVRQGASLKPGTNSPAESASTWYETVFDEAASRRRIAASSQLLVGEGSITAPSGAVDSVVLADEQGRFMDAFPLAANANNQAQPFRFRISWRETPKAYRLEFYRQGQRRFAHHFQFDPAHSWLAEQGSTPAVLADNGEKITFSYQFLVAGFPTKVMRFQRWQKHATSLAKPFFWGTLALALPFLFFGRAWDCTRLRQLFACMLLVVGWFTGRTALYGLIKAMVGWGSERYMRCISPLFLLLVLLSVALLAGILQRHLRKSVGGTTTTCPAGSGPTGLDLVEDGEAPTKTS